MQYIKLSLFLFVLSINVTYGQLDVIQFKELTFEKDNLTGISTNKINEGEDRIWISTEAGVHIYDGDRCRNIFFGSEPSLHSLENVQDIVHYSSTVKYFLYDKDVPFIERFDLKENRIDSISVSVPRNHILIDVLSQNNHDVWAVSQGVDSISFTSITAGKSSFGLRKNEISKVLKVVSSKNGFWIIDDTYQFYFISETGFELRKIQTPTTFAQANFIQLEWY